MSHIASVTISWYLIDPLLLSFFGLFIFSLFSSISSFSVGALKAPIPFSIPGVGFVQVLFLGAVFFHVSSAVFHTSFTWFSWHSNSMWSIDSISPHLQYWFSFMSVMCSKYLPHLTRPCNIVHIRSPILFLMWFEYIPFHICLSFGLYFVTLSISSLLSSRLLFFVLLLSIPSFFFLIIKWYAVLCFRLCSLAPLIVNFSFFLYSIMSSFSSRAPSSASSSAFSLPIFPLCPFTHLKVVSALLILRRYISSSHSFLFSMYSQSWSSHFLWCFTIPSSTVFESDIIVIFFFVSFFTASIIAIISAFWFVIPFPGILIVLFNSLFSLCHIPAPPMEFSDPFLVLVPSV